jgi:hypothetical protein
MKHLITISLFILFATFAFSQPTIEIYLTNHPYPSKGSVIESIEETYELMIKEVPPRPFKIITTYDKLGNIIGETKIGKTGGKQSEKKWEYNQNQELTKKTHRYFVNMLGWKIDETMLSYNDTTGYISEIRFIKNGILESTSKVFCDSMGTPFEVRVLDDKGAFSKIEKINYSSSTNIIRVMVLKSTNQFINRWLYPIDSTKPYQIGQIERQFYPNGNVMLESLEVQTKTDQGYYYEYKYDSNGNWTEKDTYQVTLGKNSKIKDKKLEHKILRTIKYY